MNASAHIEFETLVDIAEARATLAALQPAMEHLSHCSACADALDRLREMIRLMRTDTALDVPHDVLASALDIFRPEEQTILPRFVAVLTFDSRNTTRALGMRSFHTASRQVLYSAQDTDVDLRIAVQNEECILTGQVIRQNCPGGRVTVEGTAGLVETALNDLCEFTLPALPPGTYSLIVRLHDIEIEIPELELKAWV
jgi:hypothetical protein